MREIEQSSLRDYLSIIFKHKIIIATIVVITIVTVHLVLEMRTPTYVASVQMYVKGMKQTEAEYYQGINANILSSHFQLVKSSAVIDRVIKALKLDERPLNDEKKYASGLKAALIEYSAKKQMNELADLSQEEKQAMLFNIAYNSLQSNITVDYSDESTVFSISVTDFNPYQAARIANSVSRAYVIFDLEQQILELELKYGEKNSTVVQLQSYINEFEKYLDGKPLPALEAIGPASVKIIEQAKSGILVPFKPGKTMARILSLVMSLSLGILISFGIEFFNQTIKSPKDVKSFLNLSFLGSIPIAKSGNKLLMKNDQHDQNTYAESYQKLSHKLFLMIKGGNYKSVLITDVEGSDDTAYVIANLAIGLSHEAGHRVLIIDAGLRNPWFHRLLNINASPGFSDVLEGKVSFEVAIQSLDSNLYVLSAGNKAVNPVNLLNSPVTSEVLKKAKENFDIILINCSDLKNYNDAILLSSVADSLVLVVNEGKVKHQVITHALAPFEQNKINIIGAIINNRRYYIPEIIYRVT